MPRKSDTTGFLCPIAGCGGKCSVLRTKPAPHAPRDMRRRVCRKCAYEFLTREVITSPPPVRNLFAEPSMRGAIAETTK